MSLMNCNIHGSLWRERNRIWKLHATEDGASEPKKWPLEHGVRAADIAVKINNKPAGGLDGDKSFRGWGRAVRFLWEKWAKYRFANQAADCVGKWRRSRQRRTRAPGECRAEWLSVAQSACHKATLTFQQTAGKLIRREVDLLPARKPAHNISRCLRQLPIKSRSTDFNWAVCSWRQQLLFARNCTRTRTIDESFPTGRLKSRSGSKPKAVPLPDTHSLSKSSRRFPGRVVQSPNCLTKHRDNSVRAIGMMGGVTIHTPAYDEPDFW